MGKTLSSQTLDVIRWLEKRQRDSSASDDNIKLCISVKSHWSRLRKESATLENKLCNERYRLLTLLNAPTRKQWDIEITYTLLIQWLDAMLSKEPSPTKRTGGISRRTPGPIQQRRGIRQG